MKKTLWMLGVAVAALTSCTESEVLDVPESRVIGFDSHVDKATRGSIIASKNALSDFYVYGKYGADANSATTSLFSPNGYATLTWDNNHYSYEPHEIWQEDKSYYFAAYSDGNHMLTDPVTISYEPNSTSNGLIISNYTVGENDLIASVLPVINTEDDGSGIPTGRLVFQFAHLLSRVRFEVENTSSTTDDIAIKITDITFNGTTKATCTFTQMGSVTWTSPVSGNYTFNFSNLLYPTQTVIVENFVIPQSNSLTVDIVLESFKNDGTGNYTIPTGTKTLDDVSLAFANGPDENKTNFWHPGWVYNYIIKYGGDVSYIHFDAAVSDWNYDFDGNFDGGTNDDIPISTTPVVTP